MRSPSRLEAGSVREIWDIVRERYPRGTRIVRIERVVRPRGLFRRESYEAVLSVPGTGRRGPAEAGADGEAGLARLLAEADDDVLTVRRSDGPVVSTELGEFDSMLQELVAETQERQRPALPGPGDLLALVGLGDDALTVARRLGEQGLLVAVAGTGEHAGVRVTDPRDAVEARAAGVRAGAGTAVAVATDIGAGGLAEALGAVGPDLVWVVVDVSRKPGDTVHWVGLVRDLVPVHGMAVVGRELTLTPDVPEALGLPLAEV